MFCQVAQNCWTLNCSKSDLKSALLKAFLCLQDFYVLNGDIYDQTRFTVGHESLKSKLKFINQIKLFSLQVCLKVFDHNLITIRCWSSSWAVAWIILNLNKSLLTPTKSYLSNSGRSDSIIPIDSICGIVHYEITLHKLCLLSRATLPTIFCKAI